MIPGVKQGKDWGETTLLFKNMNVEVHYLKIKKGGFCSEHRHKKSNLFYIIEGRVRIKVWDDDQGALLDDTILNAGQITTVEAGFWHSFEALEDSKINEVYQIIIDENDIERRSKGGIRE